MRIPSADEIKRFAFLEDILAACTGTGTSFVCPYHVSTGLSPIETDSMVDEMMMRGFLHRDDDMTLKVGLTADGKQHLQNGFCERQNRSIFKEVVRERLLEWVNEHSSNGESVEVDLNTQERWFYGREITNSDLEMAARALEHHHLLSYERSEPDALSVTLSDEGRKCATNFGGELEAYLQSKIEASETQAA